MSILISLSCSKREEPKEIVAQINDYYMSVEDFTENLKVFTVYRAASVRTLEDKMSILDDLITKEILLQEAQTLNLHKDKRFIRTIENYWKQTLLKVLIEKKANEISDSVHIYDDEIMVYYEKLRSKNPNIMSLSEIKQDIRRTLRREKETALMQRWVSDLKEKASIKINKDVLESVKIK